MKRTLAMHWAGYALATGRIYRHSLARKEIHTLRHTLRPHLVATSLLLSFVLTHPAAKAAHPMTLTNADKPAALRHALDVGGGLSRAERGAGMLGYRLLMGESVRLGIDIRWAMTNEIEQKQRGQHILIRTPLVLRAKSFARVRFDFVVAPGVQHVERDGMSTETALTLTGGAIMHWRLLSKFALRIGASMPVAIHVVPNTEFYRWGMSVHLGMSVRFADWCWAYADGMVSVLDGLGNEPEKTAIEGQFGLRFYFGTPGPDHDIFIPLPTGF